MHSVLEHDDKTIRDGKLLAESYDYGLNSFQPDLLFEQLVKGFRNAQQLFGPTLIRELTGYDAQFIERNIKIPEFQLALKQRISQTVEELKKRKAINGQGEITEEGVKLAALVKYLDEIERIEAKGMGRRTFKERAAYEPYKKGVHRYHDIEIGRSVQLAIRRGHGTLSPSDLVATPRQQQGRISIIYAVDASGSMRGAKLRMAKQAGVALAFRAIADKNDVGLVIFTSKIEQSLEPGQEFLRILEALTTTRAGLETDIALTIEEATRLFGRSGGTKHLVLLTDAMPTKASKDKGPRRRVLEAASSARNAKITISLVGIGLDSEGESLAKRIVEIGKGKLYRAREGELDSILLEDYEELRSRGE